MCELYITDEKQASRSCLGLQVHQGSESGLGFRIWGLGVGVYQGLALLHGALHPAQHSVGCGVLGFGFRV